MKNKLFVPSLITLSLGLVLLLSQFFLLLSEEKYTLKQDVAGIDSTISTYRISDPDSTDLRQKYFQIGLLSVLSISLILAGALGMALSSTNMKERLGKMLEGEEPADFEE